jgi:hypothetical protein
MTNQELAKLAILNENTPELGQYWQKRYEKFLKNNVFILSEKTQSLLGQKEPIDSPATPYGYLNLPIFLGKNKVVDEVMLQNCIETAVRFLDSLLDVINFTTEAKHLINQNRKIGLGVVNFEEYLANRETASKVEEIDYIGEIISSSSYRASEALAEEKGSCDSWNNLAFMIRPKPFEYWYNSETGEVKSGLDIAEEFTSTNLLSSHFEIIPRRNSHILLYPNDQEWQIWSDRDENSVITANTTNQPKTQEAPIISTHQDDNNDYSRFEQEIPNTEIKDELNTKSQSLETQVEFKNPSINQDHSQFTNPAPIDDLPLINPISTLQQKISKWFAVEPNSETSAPQNTFDLSKNNQKIDKTSNHLPIPKLQEANLDPEIITEIKEVEIIKEVPVEVIREVEVIKNIEIVKEVNKSILVQIVSLSSDAKKILVDKNSQLPTIKYDFQKDLESEVLEKVNLKFGLNIDFMEISSIDLFEDQFYISYQAKIQELQSDNGNLYFDFIEALSSEQDKVAYSKSINRVKRWQQSSKIKAQELLKEYNQKQQIQVNENESKIITQKNLFIEELQIRIKKLIDENSKIENQKNQEIRNLNNNLEETKLKLKAIGSKSIIIEKPLPTPQLVKNFKEETKEEAEVVLIKNDNLTFDLNNQIIPNQQPIPTININTNTMTQNPDPQSQADTNQASFRTSRDKMFMPTLEIETKLGVPVIVHNSQNDDVDEPSDDTAKIIQRLDPKSPNHAANVLLKLKKLAR